MWGTALISAAWSVFAIQLTSLGMEQDFTTDHSTQQAGPRNSYKQDERSWIIVSGKEKKIQLENW